MYKIGLLGFGKMGEAIINGIIDAKLYTNKDILIYSLETDKILSAGFASAKNELEVFENSELVIFAIKPQTFPEVMSELKKATKTPKLILSIAAGITLDYLKNNLGDLKYVRVMPNTSVSIKQGATTMAIGQNVSLEEAKPVKDIFDALGVCEIVDEELINVLLPLNGSYPAYFYYFVRGFIKTAVENGATYEQAKQIIANASIGCANMLMQTEKDLDTLINDVCSKGGTTIEGIYVFDNHNLNDTIKECSVNCSKRAKELEK